MEALMNEISVSFADNSVVHCPYGTRVENFISHLDVPGEDLAAVMVNNEVHPLATRIEVNSKLQAVLIDSPAGAMIYRRSLSFILALAARELFPNRCLLVGHSLGNGYFYTFNDEYVASSLEIECLERKMREIVAADELIRYYHLSYADALEHFQKNGQTDTALLLEQGNASRIPVNECMGFIDLAVAPLVPRTSVLSAFELRFHENGFLLRYPAIGAGRKMSPFDDSPKIFSVYKEYKSWGRNIGVNSVGQLNQLIANKQIQSFIQISEAFQSKKLGELADKIYQKRDEIKIILIAGPSSSGKTTSAKRLSIMLKVMGLEPVAIALDDYFLGRERTPKDENGEPDFECLEALDVPLFNQHLVELLEGREVELPIFDFRIGGRRSEGRKLKLDDRHILIVEGIHGLNDALTSQIPREKKFKLYVSALTQLNLDDHNRIPTSDNRLIRRMVRDFNFRNHNAQQTIKMWPNVQKGERKHIFPFQDSADAAFNSALDYELAVLKVFAMPLLRSVKPTMDEYAEASRLASFLENFSPVQSHMVPSQSILREFVGGSEFKY
jgi:uridine kinase